MILVLVLVMLRKSPCWRGEPPHVVDPEMLVGLTTLFHRMISVAWIPKRFPTDHAVSPLLTVYVTGGAPLTTLLCGVST